MTDLDFDVLVIGAGAAGMYAALEASRGGANVALVDKSMVGRGGATIMAQMTVSAAVGHQEPDSWQEHFLDTVVSGRGIADERLAALMCHDGPARILESWSWGVNWATEGERLHQVKAPGHSNARCCYVAGLQTGVGIVKGLRKELRRRGVTQIDTMLATGLVQDAEGAVVGASGLELRTGMPTAMWAPSVVIATGGLTELFARNSASASMTGDGHALAYEAGAELIDMEMVQFFPIGNLAPRTIGLDPIMWDPFRYVLGGRLLNGLREEFVHRYADEGDGGTYRATRDRVTYAIMREVEAGRGSPSGGAFLDFTHLPEEQIRAAFPAAFERLKQQGIDLTVRPVEVAPTAHYTIGGIRVDIDMRTSVPGLFAVGEAVGGQHGANRLSGNALTETFVFGARGGIAAAAAVPRGARPDDHARQRMAELAREVHEVRGRDVDSSIYLPALRTRLKRVMWDFVGPFRTGAGLADARTELEEIAAAMRSARVDPRHEMNLECMEWFELRGMLTTAELIRAAAVERTESRGAHQRLDHPEELPEMAANLIVRRGDKGMPEFRWSDPVLLETDVSSWEPPLVLAPLSAGSRR